MADKLTDARRSLICAQESARKRLEELDHERSEIRDSLKSLAAALKALGRPVRGRPSPQRLPKGDGPDSDAVSGAS